jgi:hypothetical protein
MAKSILKQTHPYLIQFDKVTKNALDYEYIGVYVDQGQKDLNEVLIEFVNFADNTGLPYFNKVFTTNGLKFRPNLSAFGNFYYLLSDDAFYLLPARQPNKINGLGTRISLFKDKLVFDFKIINSAKGELYILEPLQNESILMVGERWIKS